MGTHILIVLSLFEGDLVNTIELCEQFPLYHKQVVRKVRKISTDQV